MADERGTLAFDIETAPLGGMEDRLPEPKINSRLTDPKKIAQAKKDAREKQTESMALDARAAQIISIHVFRDGDSPRCCIQGCPQHGSPTEADLLRWFWDHVAAGLPRLVTYNGAAFDVPLIEMRSAILGVKAKRTIETGRYRVLSLWGDHVDLHRVFDEKGWCNSPCGFRSRLSDFAKHFLCMEHPKSLQDKVAYKEWWQFAQYDKLEAAGAWDVTATLEMYNYLRNVLA